MSSGVAPDIDPLVSLLDVKINILERLTGELKRTETWSTAFSNLIDSRLKAQTTIIQALSSCASDKLDRDDPYVASFVDMLNEELKLQTYFKEKLKTNLDESRIKVKELNKNKIVNSANKLHSSLSGVKKELKDSHDRYQKTPNLDKFNKAFSNLTYKASSAINKFDTDICSLMTDFKSQVSEVGKATQVFSEYIAELNRIVGFNITRMSNEYRDKLTLYDPVLECDQFCEDLISNSGPRKTLDNIAYAISDFRSNSPNDLNFERGDRIKITNKDRSGWWQGELQGKRGFFPKTFVCQEFGGIESVDAMFMCKKDYKASSVGMYIDLLMGDIVFLETYTLSGNNHRCSGTNLRTGKRGYFPLECIETGGELVTEVNRPDE